MSTKTTAGVLSTVLCLLAPLPAIALSCIRPPAPIEVLNQARENPDSVVVGIGTFTGWPLTVATKRGSKSAKFKFSGALLQNGKSTPVEKERIIATVSCLEPWCGAPIRVKRKQNYLVAFQRDKGTGQLSLYSDACYGSVIMPTTLGDTSNLAKCLAKGSCETKDLGVKTTTP